MAVFHGQQSERLKFFCLDNKVTFCSVRWHLEKHAQTTRSRPLTKLHKWKVLICSQITQGVVHAERITGKFKRFSSFQKKCGTKKGHHHLWQHIWTVGFGYMDARWHSGKNSLTQEKPNLLDIRPIRKLCEGDLLLKVMRGPDLTAHQAYNSSTCK